MKKYSEKIRLEVTKIASKITYLKFREDQFLIEVLTLFEIKSYLQEQVLYSQSNLNHFLNALNHKYYLSRKQFKR